MAPAVMCARWDEVALDKVTEMVSRKSIARGDDLLVQSYLKKGALVPLHTHAADQWIYVLQGALELVVAGERVTLREGDVGVVPAWAPHQAEAIDDTFVLDFRRGGTSLDAREGGR
jgi:quercetin dioxygenase-like cupin family protein